MGLTWKSGFLLLALLLMVVTAARGQNYIVDEREKAGDQRRFIVTIFPFYSEVLGFSGGITYSARGRWQRQVYSKTTAIASSNNSLFVISSINDLQLFNRLFLSAEIRAGRFGSIKSYSGMNARGEVAGRNDSDKDNFREAEGTDTYLSPLIQYLLPVGHGKEHAIAEIVMDEGTVVDGQTGGTDWHPFASGRTFFELRPFHRRRELDITEIDEVIAEEVSTNGMGFGLRYENIDFSENPSAGSVYSVTYNRDFGWFSSDTEWDAVEFEYAKYFTLFQSAGIKQSVLAVDLWTSNVVSWNDFDIKGDGTKLFHRPPTFFGSTLGGGLRLRGFDAYRYSGRSAIHYTIEYRHTPNWKPLHFKILANKIHLSWFQFVLFSELGRVAEIWDLADLHKEMQWDAGIGVRPWINNLLVRADLGFSDEGIFVTMTINQPF